MKIVVMEALVVALAILDLILLFAFRQVCKEWDSALGLAERSLKLNEDILNELSMRVTYMENAEEEHDAEN